MLIRGRAGGVGVDLGILADGCDAPNRGPGALLGSMGGHVNDGVRFEVEGAEGGNGDAPLGTPDTFSVLSWRSGEGVDLKVGENAGAAGFGESSGGGRASGGVLTVSLD